MLAEHDEPTGMSQGPEQHLTSFYGPEKPQYEEMVSIIQGEAFIAGELMDENLISQIDKGGPSRLEIIRAYGADEASPITQLQVQSHDDGDTGGGSQAQTHSPHSIKQQFGRKVTKAIGGAGAAKNIRVTDGEDDEDDLDDDDEEDQF